MLNKFVSYSIKFRINFSCDRMRVIMSTELLTQILWNSSEHTWNKVYMCLRSKKKIDSVHSEPMTRPGHSRSIYYRNIHRVYGTMKTSISRRANQSHVTNIVLFYLHTLARWWHIYWNINQDHWGHVVGQTILSINCHSTTATSFSSV